MIMFAEGAYGRESNIADWIDGRDFSMAGGCGPYFSIRDVKAIFDNGNTEIQFLDKFGWVKFAEKLS
jgi:hypothetical protein